MIGMRKGCLAIACTAVVLMTGCSSMSALNPFDNSPKLTALKPAAASATTQRWQATLGDAVPGLVPAVVNDTVYAAASDGTVLIVNAATGAQVARFNIGARLSAGVGTDGTLVVVGTSKGAVIATDTKGGKKWQSTVKGEIVSPPSLTDGVVMVVTGDGTVHGLDATNGAARWTIARAQPALTVRNHAGMITTRRAGFLGTAGGRLIAFDTVTGSLGWESVVANPKGTTELDRIADVISQPVFDDRVVCATAYQGRTGCFDLQRGSTVWLRDISSRSGLATDSEHIYVIDEKFVLHALDKSTGASVWKQDGLAGRRVTSPQVVAGSVLVVDAEGVYHLIDTKKGEIQGRSTGESSQPLHQPVSYKDTLIWQTPRGALVSVGKK